MRDVADDGHAQAFERPQRSRMVRASSSAWVGCSCVPSPALMIGVGRWRARKCGAPRAAWRITMASGRIAASVFSVSTSDSPLDTLEPDAVIETASAPRRLAAISKLVRVRVEASKKRLTIILPRSVSSFFKRLALHRLKILGARQNGFDLGAVQLFDPEQSGGHVRQRLPRDLLHQQHLFHAVDLLELHFDDLDVGGLHRAADEARLDRQFAVAAIDQHQQLHARRTAVVEQRVERGANRAARCTARRPSG